MQTPYRLGVYLLLTLGFCPVIGYTQGQNLTDSTSRIKLDSGAVYQEVTSFVDDTLETTVLRRVNTPQQLVRIVDYISLANLRLVPAVLPVKLPLSAFEITSPFGIRRHPIHHDIRFHGGVDVKAKAGQVVKATAIGIVTQIGQDEALGIFVHIRHAFGFETLYGHLAGYCVKPGQTVQRNEEIGRVGQTGQATGPHLHYGIKKNGSNVDPFQFCFLLRRRLHNQANKPPGSGSSSSLGAVIP